MSNVKETEKQMLVHCFHCGNKGLLNIVGRHSLTRGEAERDEFGQPPEDDPLLGEYFTWFLLSCPVCEMVTLYREYSNEREGADIVCDILYPHNKIDLRDVPGHIKSAFESALKVKEIDSAICLLSLRRTLEAICKDKGAGGKTLDEMVKDLIEKNVLPLALDDACWIIRQLGNAAAHTSETIFYPYEVRRVIDFVQTIINYLYELPAQIAYLKKQIKHHLATDE